MQELKAKIYDKTNGVSYTLMGDYYIPDVKLPEDRVLLPHRNGDTT